MIICGLVIPPILFEHLVFPVFTHIPLPTFVLIVLHMIYWEMDLRLIICRKLILCIDYLPAYCTDLVPFLMLVPLRIW